MFTVADADYIGLCLEWFLYGVYSGIFAIYLQCPKKDSRTAMIVFYILCLLYVLSTATVVCDLISTIFDIYVGLQIDMLSMSFRLMFVQITLSGCCDTIAQFILVYRCWIVWGKDIRVIIIPSFLAIVYIATWIASEVPLKINFTTAIWGNTMTLTALAATMAVNTLATGLIVFKILKVFLEVKVTSIERTLGASAGRPNYQHILFIIIESGMALFAAHLGRIVISSLLEVNPSLISSGSIALALNLVIFFHQMLNGIAPTIILVRVSMGLSFDDEESFKEGVGSLNFYNPPSDPNTPALGSSGSIPLQEMDEDICFNNCPSDDSNSLRRMGSTSSNTPPQERIEVTVI